MYCTVETATILGIRAIRVQVQVHIASGLPALQLVGLPDVMVQESRERVRAALKSAGFSIPASRITVNLAPASLRKHGSAFDLPIALGIAVASGQLSASVVTGVLAAGELSLNGGIQPAAGLLAYARLAVDDGLILLGAGVSESVGLMGGSYREVPSLATLREAPPRTVTVNVVEAAEYARALADTAHLGGVRGGADLPDFADVIGQEAVIRALTVAATGRHNVLMVGPPGTGKTMLARRFAAVLPPPTAGEYLESALIHSVSNVAVNGFVAGRPFRDPHHSSTTVGLVGGGNPPHPGEVSLAHNGVLFLDELPQFGTATLQALRGPLEDRKVSLVRSEYRIEYPASFQLVAAANPCPCGYLGDSVVRCGCSSAAIERYQSRIGGPLLDRFDISVRVARPDPDGLLGGRGAVSTVEVAARVSDAQRDAARNGAPTLGSAARRALVAAARKIPLSPRAALTASRVAASVALLEGSREVGEDHLFEALSYRVGFTS